MNVQGQPLQQPGGQAQAQQQQAQQQQQGPPAPVIFARTPARFQQNHLLNYREKSDIEIYNKGAAPLTGEAYDGTNIHQFLVKVGEKAKQYNWMPILTFGARNLVANYGEISYKDVLLASMAFQAVRDRRAQDSDMLFHCLSASITTKVRATVALEPSKYTLIINNGVVDEEVLDGVTYLKAIIDSTYTYSLSKTALARQALSSLDKYMEGLSNSSVTELCKHAKEKLQELQAAGETTHDLIVNLFKALAKAKDKVFRTRVQSWRDEWTSGKKTITQDCAAFLVEAENYYKDRVDLGEWLKLDDDQETIVLLKAQLLKKAPGKENNPNRANRGKGKGKGKEGAKKDDWAWKKVEPKGSEPRTKSVFNKKEKKNMAYHWCSHHKLWTIHTEAECTKGKGDGKVLGEVQPSADKKTSKLNKQKITMRVLATLAELPSDSEDCASP